jgi:hypothetical protein
MCTYAKIAGDILFGITVSTRELLSADDES